MGASHNDLLNKKCKLTWEWCKSDNVCLYLVHVNRKHSSADKPSRKTYILGEWILSKRIFSKVLSFDTIPTIDLFSSRLNNQLPTYVSCKAEPHI